jgi:hypothetical protein
MGKLSHTASINTNEAPLLSSGYHQKNLGETKKTLPKCLRSKCNDWGNKKGYFFCDSGFLFLRNINKKRTSAELRVSFLSRSESQETSREEDVLFLFLPTPQ